MNDRMQEFAGNVGWYGKMPANGDFVHRRLSRDLILWWDKWLQSGLSGLPQTKPTYGEDAYLQAPLWNFAIPHGPGSGSVQLGCIAPSRDRVGRCYPLLIVLAIPIPLYQPQILSGASRFYRHLGASMLGALRRGCNAEQFDRSLQGLHEGLAQMLDSDPHGSASQGDDILSVLNGGHEAAQLGLEPHGLGWPELPVYFNPSSHTSYWWTNTAEGAAHKSHVHGGALNTTLFNKLFIAHAGYR